MCALFCNEDGEDVGEFNDAIIMQEIGRLGAFRHSIIRDFLSMRHQIPVGRIQQAMDHPVCVKDPLSVKADPNESRIKYFYT